MRTKFKASPNLRRLYDERVGDSMTQAQFAKRYKLGGQTMLSQIMNGTKPLPIDAAQKLARALRCSISDICPEMADYIKEEIVPALGKSWRRAASLLLCLLPILQAPDANAAGFDINKIGHPILRQVIESNTHWARMLRWLSNLVRNQGFPTACFAR
jgi:transcriptional regulator with XRE-family HTH domain